MNEETKQRLQSIDGVDDVVLEDGTLVVMLEYHIPTQNGYQLRMETLREVGSQIARAVQEDDTEYQRVEKPEPIQGAQQYNTYKYRFEPVKES